MSDERDFNDPKYKRWRKSVYKRDRWKCRMPACTSTSKRLNAHHIKKWGYFPSLRFVVGNGITLCRTCHQKVWGHEEDYESLFLQILSSSSSDVAIQLLMMRYASPEEET